MQTILFRADFVGHKLTGNSTDYKSGKKPFQSVRSAAVGSITPDSWLTAGDILQVHSQASSQ